MPVKAFLAAVGLVAVVIGMTLPNPNSGPKAQPQSSQLHAMQVGSR